MATPSLLRPSSTAAITVKELVDSTTLSSVPSDYIVDGFDADSAVQDQIPTIDFSLLTSGDPLQRSDAVRELGRACEDWGFFMVMNHGVPEKLCEAMLEACRDFFDLPEEEKKGYSGKHVLDPIRCGTSFNLAVEKVRCWRDYFKVFVHPQFHSPEKPPGLREVSSEYVTRIRGVVKELLKGVCESLGLESNYMEKALEVDEAGLQILTGNLYPPCPQPHLSMGLPPHSDHGLLTVLFQNGIDGLQVRHDDKWVHVKHLPGSLLVNIGDHLEIISNGKYKSVLHRAVVNGATTRISIAVAHGPSMDTVVTPAPRLVDGENPRSAYRGMRYGDFLDYQQSNPLNGKSVLDLIRVQTQ
ncbi:Thebaine 6-O-demethylase [Acorus calamus]|uniref:Thebaine 6-O-demethylase n=1 Tax=Acorus calamus TaxID=4465 RepID=A0AAV9CIL1_ACOCL|nr:Thebaine 6-O-demethylase [Acorus calamus]